MDSQFGVPLDVCLLNGRAYVQATQMLGRTSKLLDPQDTRLTHAKFVRLTQHEVCARVGEPPVDDGEVIGSATFTRGLEKIVYRFIERCPLAPRRDRTSHAAIFGLEHDGALSGHFSFSCDAVFEGVLDALVQGIKAMHEALGPETSDVWFTGLRNFDLPLCLPGFAGQGVACVTRLRLLARPPRQQSLVKVSLSLEGMSRPIEGLVSFAFNPGSDHVD